jgi:hypothetical protein
MVGRLLMNLLIPLLISNIGSDWSKKLKVTLEPDLKPDQELVQNQLTLVCATFPKQLKTTLQG